MAVITCGIVYIDTITLYKWCICNYILPSERFLIRKDGMHPAKALAVSPTVGHTYKGAVLYRVLYIATQCVLL